MRRSMLLCAAVLFSLEAFAQERPQRPPRLMPGQRVAPPSLEGYDAVIQQLAAAIRRDAFIVAQMALATRDLHDFQKLAAVEKARDRVQKAQQKANEEPSASRATFDTLNGLRETLDHATRQGTMADTDALRREILERTHFIQLELYRELDVARREHQTIVALEAKLHQLGSELQSAMVDALGTTFDFTRAGGR